MEFSVRIVDDGGSPREGTKVTAHYPWTWSEEFTDEDGWAHFEKDGDGVNVKIYAGGDLQTDTYVEDGDTFSFTLS